jgi:hypothetical protein
MNKTLLPMVIAMFLILSFSTACAEQVTGEAKTKQFVAESDQADATDDAKKGVSLMNQPVDFSTPEKAEETLQNIREQEGEKAYKMLKSAMDYVAFYDLSVGNDRNKLYKKLNGRTPNEILAKMKRK